MSYGHRLERVRERLAEEFAEVDERHTRVVLKGIASGQFALQQNLPDSDVTVLLLTNDAENPVWPGFHDGEQWCTADGTTLEGVVLGWMHIEDAAALLKTLPPKSATAQIQREAA